MKNILVIVLGLAIGLGLGLLYSWVIDPVEYTGTALNSLRSDYQLQYAALVAQTFAVEQDTARAQARLAPLGGNAAQTMAAFAQRAAAAGVDANTVQAMSALAGALGAGPVPPTITATSVATTTPAPESTSTPTPTNTPTITPTPTNTPRLLPTRTPSPTPLGAFVFVSQEALCDPTLPEPLLQVITLDAAENPLPGVAVGVEWAGGFDRFFTGLKPELGLGYGDFTMQPDTDYTLRLLDSPNAFVAGLHAETCFTLSGQTYPGSWLVVFQQP